MTRDELIDYCYRKLGHPVININVDREQADDRIGDALQLFKDYHYDGSSTEYVGFKLTGSTLKFTVPNSNQYQVGEIVTGQTSGATGIIYDIPDSYKIRCREFTGTFLEGESVLGSQSLAINTVAVNGIFIGDLQKKYFVMPNGTMGVNKIFPITQTSSTTTGMFDPAYHMKVDAMYNMGGSASIFNYSTIKRHLELIGETFNTEARFKYNRIVNELHPYFNWSAMKPDGWIMIEASI